VSPGSRPLLGRGGAAPLGLDTEGKLLLHPGEYRAQNEPGIKPRVTFASMMHGCALFVPPSRIRSGWPLRAHSGLDARSERHCHSRESRSSLGSLVKVTRRGREPREEAP
jgi:hypothetical protein